jgi:hypothetical protein
VHSSLRNIIDDDVFRNTGAFIVYRDKPTQLRYHAALRHTASQKERATWIRELEAGRSVPGIEWVLSPTGKNLKAADIASHCRAGTPSGPVRLTLYRGSQ